MGRPALHPISSALQLQVGYWWLFLSDFTTVSFTCAEGFEERADEERRRLSPSVGRYGFSHTTDSLTMG